MADTPLIPAPPLGRAVLDLLPRPRSTVLVAGGSSLVRTLRHHGHEVDHAAAIPEAISGVTDMWGTDRVSAAELESFSVQAPTPEGTAEPTAGLGAYDALVLVSVLLRLESPLPVLRRLVSVARPGCLILSVEPAAWGRGGRLLGRLLGRLARRPLVVDVSGPATLFLNSGLSGVRQVWPQGLRSLVLTHGWVHSQARSLL